MKTLLRVLLLLLAWASLGRTVGWAQAPVARNQSGEVLLNSGGTANLLLPLAARTGTPTSFTITGPLPTAAQGVLGINGTPITAVPRTVTLAQASQLTFTPAASFFGTYVFQYTATNASGTGAAAAYAIPVSNASCSDGSNINFFARTLNEDWTTAKTVTVGGTTLTTSNYSEVTGAGTILKIDDNGTMPGVALTWSADYTSGSTTANTSSITFNFSRAVTGLTMTVGDIDLSANAWTDQLTVDGYTAANAKVVLTNTDYKLGSIGANTYSGNNVFTGTASSGPAATEAGNSNVIITFPQAISRLTLTYRNILNVANPSLQVLTIPSMSWCALADAATTLTGPASLSAGVQSGNYTATFANNGPDNAENTTRTVTIPANAASAVTSATGTVSGSQTAGWTITYPSGIFASGNSVSSTFTLTPLAVSSIAVTSSTTTTTNQSTTANDQATVTLNVTPIADVATTLTGPGSLSAGQTSGNYTVTYANNGPSPAAGTTRTVTIPANRVSAVSAPSGIVSGSQTAGWTITYPGGTVASGNSVSYAFTVTPGLLTSGNTIAINSTTTTTTNQGVNTAPDAATVSYVVGAIADVSATFTDPTATSTTVAPGTTNNYTVQFANAGPSSGANVTRTVSIPAGVPAVTQTGGTLTGSQAAGWTITYPGGTIAAGNSDSYTFSVVAPSTGSVTITATTTTTTNQGANVQADSDTRTLNVTAIPISGFVFDDVNYGGGNGRNLGAANTAATGSGFANNAVRRSGATVELYDAAGNFVATTTTNANGQYTFNLPSSANYTVRVVNSTVTSVRALNTGASATGLIPVQTFVLNGQANKVGGEAPEKQDAPANNGSQTLAQLTTGTQAAQSLYSYTAGTAGQNGINFGYSFDVISNVNDAGQGSLRQFILNSNALSNTNLNNGPVAGTEYSIFMIPDGLNHAGLSVNNVNQLTNGVARITLATALPNITDANTALDGTEQTTNVGDNNPAVATAGSESTGPEVVINFNGLSGLGVTAANTTITGLGFTSAAGGSGTAALRIDAGATGAVVQNNTLFNNGANMRINNVGGATVSGNILRDATASNSDGIELTNSPNNVITNNQFLNNAGYGIDFITGASDGNTITGNLFKKNGQNTSDGQTAGIGIRSNSSNNIISGNTFTENVGDGISAKAGINNVFSQNIFFNNSDLAIDLTGTTNNNGDGVTLNENGDGDAGANGLINFPIINSVTIRNGNLLLTGFAAPGAKIEFYVAAPDPSGFGEGQTYLFTQTEGVNDLDATTGSYSGLINGRNQGSEINQNRFSYSIALSSLTQAQRDALLASGAQLTSTATLTTLTNGNQGTSEFSGNAPVQNAPVANNDYATTTPGTTVILTVTDNDQNSIDPATVALNGLAAGSTTTVTVTGGTFTFLSNGQVRFIPAAGFTGVATVPYTVNNTSGAVSNTAFISVAVSGTTFNLATNFSVIPTGPVNAGSSVSYTVVSSNPGTVAATSVVETMQLPAGLSTGFTVGGSAGTPNAATGITTFPNGTYNQNTGLLTLNIGNLAANGGAVSTALVFPAPFNSPLTVTANISGNGGVETTVADNVAVSTINITPRFDVTTAISGPTTVIAGNEVTYTVVTSNLSSTTSPANANSVSPAVNVVQTVSLPGNLTGAGIYASNGGTVAYNSTQNATVITFPAIGVLAAGQSQVNTISFTAPSNNFSAPTAIVTSGLTGTNAGDLNSSTVGTDNNTAQLNGAATRPTITSATRTGTEANVYTNITASAANVAPGANITLNITAGNAGAAAAAGVQQSVSLPTGLTFSSLNGGTYNANTGLLTFPALTSNLAAGATQSYTVTFAAPQQGFVLATASVTTTTPDAVPADNLAQTKIEVNPVVDVATTLAGPAVTLPGQPVTYTVTTASNGPATANSVVQTVQLPTGLTNVQLNSLSAGSQYNSTTGILTITFSEPLAAGYSQTNTISFTAPAGATNLNVSAAVSTSSAETIVANNAATVITAVTPAADVAISVTGPATATVGNPVPYAVSVTNNGSAVATGVAPTLQLPAGLGTANVTFPAGSTTGSYNNTTGLVTFSMVSALASGASATNVVVVTMPDAAQLSAVGQVATTSYDTNLANNYATVTTTAATATTATADLRVTTSTATAITANAGSAVTITPVFSNLGSATANSVIPQLTLVPGLTGVTVTDGGVTRNADYNATTGVVTFQSVGSLASGASLPGTYSVTFNAPATGPVLAVASIYSATSDGALANNTALTTVTVTPQADAQTSIAGPASAQPGSRVTYEITTSNNSTAVSPSTNVVQTVTIPGTPANLTFSAGAMSTVTGGNTFVTFPTVASMAPGTAGAVTNFVSFTTPATATTLNITANVTSAADINTSAASNSASISTIANNAPVAYNVVNGLLQTGEVRFNQVIENTATTAQPISPLVATDVNAGQALTYTLTSLPTSGSLYIGASTTALGVGSSITATQASQLRYLPATGFVGNAFFSYTATDNATVPATSNTAIYTIAVGQDAGVAYALTTVKGGSTAYQTGDVIANAFDANSGTYNSATPQAVVKTGLSSATLVTTGLPAGYLSSFPAGVGFNTTDANQTGQIVVTNNRLLVAGTYTVRIATVDLNGGISTRDVTFTIGVRPLPVELVSFAAKAIGQDAQLVWRTAQELHNDHFVVERSFDGKSFSAVGQVKGQGTTTTATDYRFTDTQAGAKALGQVAYYRLRQVDTDGTTNFSAVQAVTFAKAEVSISLYPNPATSSTTLNLTSLPQGSYQVTIVDITGRLIRQARYEAGTTPTLSVQELPAGTYLVVVRGQGFNKSLRLVKE